METEIKKLVLAKKLYLHGCNHADKKDAISRMIAIHNFDNVVEMILKTVAIKQKKKPDKTYFIFPELIKKLKSIPMEEQIVNLHNLRNHVQHSGDIPDHDTVIKYRGYVEDFFREIVKGLGINFDELSLSILIQNKDLKEKLLRAEKEFKNEKYANCISLCNDAFIMAVSDIGKIFGKAGLLTYYWSVDKKLAEVIHKDYVEKYKKKEFYEPIRDIIAAIINLGQASTSMQFLDEYRADFLHFITSLKKSNGLSKEELKEFANFSLNFVTDVLLKWQTEGITK